MYLEIETLGVRPGPRHSHSMIYNEKLLYLIVHGGKYEGTHELHYNDTFILLIDNHITINWKLKVLNLVDLSWIKIINLGHEPI